MDIWRSDFSIRAKVSRLSLDRHSGFEQFTLRGTTVLANSEQLTTADLPVVDPVQGTTIVLDKSYLGLRAGQIVCLTGTRSDLDGVIASELRTISKVLLTAGYTTVVFGEALTYSYIRNTVTINANIVRAGHGETVQQVLGSGDGKQNYQRFTLGHSPLTYISAATASGVSSTLQVRVNDLLWHEVATLQSAQANDRIFIALRDSDEKTTVEFGNGVTGAKLPTGQLNVTSTYRKGSGTAGNLKPGQLNLLITRPLGVRSAVNPLPATGGVDSENVADVARNAPLATRTLDRIVSLKDYEYFSRAFAGVAKALATWTWNQHSRGVFLTVAGPSGAEVSAASSTYANLVSALQSASPAFVPILVKSYRKAFFRIAGRITISSEYQLQAVLTAVEQALRSNFSFDAREFGQVVALSEVIATIQVVPGVVTAEIDRLARIDGIGGDGRLAPLPVALPQATATRTLLGAELLTLDPAPLEIAGVIT